MRKRYHRKSNFDDSKNNSSILLPNKSKSKKAAAKKLERSLKRRSSFQVLSDLNSVFVKGSLDFLVEDSIAVINEVNARIHGHATATEVIARFLSFTNVSVHPVKSL